MSILFTGAGVDSRTTDERNHESDPRYEAYEAEQTLSFEKLGADSHRSG